MRASHITVWKMRIIHKTSWPNECCIRNENYVEDDNRQGELVEKNTHHKIHESIENKVTDWNIPIRPCTQVWKLVNKITPLIKNHISKTLGNGKKVLIWEDRIMGKETLNLLPGHEDIQKWMNDRGLKTLYSISKWEDWNWQEWHTIGIPPNLKGQWDSLRQHLKGVAPTSIEEEDTFAWDPSGGYYTVNTGYIALQE